MTNWIESPRPLSAGWEAQLEQLGLTRTDRVDQEWIDLDSGCSIALVANGGWRQAAGDEPGPAEYRLYHRAPTGQVLDLTGAVLRDRGQFDRTARGASAYTGAFADCRELIGRLLQATLIIDPDAR